MEESRRELISGVLQEDKELMQLLKKRKYLSVLAYLNGHGFDCSMDELQEIAGELTGVKPSRDQSASESGKAVGSTSRSGQKTGKIHPTWKKVLLIAAVVVAVAVMIAAVPIGLSISDHSDDIQTSEDGTSSGEETAPESGTPSNSFLSARPGKSKNNDGSSAEKQESGDASEQGNGNANGSADDPQTGVSDSSEGTGETSVSTGTPDGPGLLMTLPGQYAVTLSPEGGKLQKTEVLVRSGSLYGELPVPEDGPGYFAGWFYHAEDMTDVAWWYAYSDRVTANTVVSQQEPHTLYAHWTKDQCSPTFIASGIDRISSGDNVWSGSGPMVVRMKSDVSLYGWALYEDGFDHLEYKIDGKTYRCGSNLCDRADKDGMYGMLSLEEGKDAGFGSEKAPVVLQEIGGLKGGSYKLELFSVSNEGNRDRIKFGESDSLELIVDDGAYLEWASASEYNGHRYKVFHEQISWSAAKAKCESLGGHLATVTTKKEQDFLVQLKGQGFSCWIGLYADEDGKWNWVTGEEMSFTQWDPGEPNGFPYERYAAIWPVNWNDLCDDSFEQEGFVCEWDA